MHVDVSYPISTGVIGARSCRTYTDTRKNTQTRREKREERGGLYRGKKKLQRAGSQKSLNSTKLATFTVIRTQRIIFVH